MRLGTALPLVAAPMAGGPTTVRLARAAADAGAFAFLAAGYKTADVMAAEIDELRQVVSDFGVNVFVPRDEPVGQDAFRRYAVELQPEAERYGIDISEAPLVHDDDHWPEKLEMLLSNPVSVVSTTFGLPREAELAALQRVGTAVFATITTVEEARVAAALGVDGLVVQGSSAGGHSGTHDPHRTIAPMPTDELTRAVIASTELPVIAAGGVDGPLAVRQLRDAGATAVGVGTLLLRTDESGASQTHKDALADPAFTETVITHAFTGRPARGLRNEFIDAHEASAPIGYPEIHHLTRELRRAAAAAGDPHRLHLWAGTGYRAAPTGPASAVIADLATLL
jgi:nitronate monooxygenase